MALSCDATNWWRTGWTAPLFWSGLGLLLLLLLLCCAVLLYWFCPRLCACLPCCATREQQRHTEHSTYEEVGDYRPARPPTVTLDYEVPRHYAASADVRTAKKKSNLANRDLEERFRKASGVGRQQQM